MYTDLEPLPLWKPSHPAKLSVGMGKNAPFIVTQHLQRSDLGLCIICTKPPRFVAKIHAFKTFPEFKKGNDRHNQKQLDLTAKNDYARLTYFHTRDMAEELANRASEMGISIKEYIENVVPSLDVDDDFVFPRTYDDEFDEPRYIAKVPGLNVYLELYGCLDDIQENEIEWDGYNGAFAVLKRMSLWAQNIWTREERRPRASKADDLQLMSEWCEDFDETKRPTMPHKKGIGIWPYIDASRRPELQHAKAPKFAGADIDRIREIKDSHADQDALGTKR